MGEGVSIAIVDYGLGNLFSIGQACRHAGMGVEVTSDVKTLASADAILLPGVGAFADAMQALKDRDLVSPLKDLCDAGKPLIGVCLGLQLLMTESHEFGSHQGLDLIRGTVERLPEGGLAPDGKRTLKVPQVGWNRVAAPDETDKWANSPLEDLKDGTYMYFVHSYHANPTDAGVVLSVSDFGGVRYCSSIRKGNIFACQFHPERSGDSGLKVYENIAGMLKRGDFK